jgi:hypothetical protein
MSWLAVPRRMRCLSGDRLGSSMYPLPFANIQEYPTSDIDGRGVQTLGQEYPPLLSRFKRTILA